MGKPRQPEKAVVFIAALFARQEILDDALRVLGDQFGNILYKSPTLPWDSTSFYCKELGTPIYRSFIFFDKIIDSSTLAETKIITNEIENSFLKDKNRQINLDPGYMTLAKIVLASTKNYSHRINIGQGIYAELTLLYRNNQFNPLPYTYNDYKDEKFLTVFREARKILKSANLLFFDRV